MDRIEIIKKIIKKIKAETYIEIGVEFGTVFSKIRIKRKIAVDPKIKISWKKKLIDSLKLNDVKYFEETSDKFFSQHSDLFKKGKIDVAFVDGLHTYQQTLKDIENCLKFLNEKGIIIVHDCNPTNEFSAVSDREIAKKAGQKKWNGDVWKAILHLRSTRQDLEIFTLDCDYGLGIIKKIPTKEKLDFLPEQIKKMSYQDLEKNRGKFLNLKNIDYFEEFLALLNKRNKK